jgi:DeoR/GlpR family transcriptional regulator of sugar metabolism
MISIADQTIVMADSSKFGIHSFVQVAPLNQIHQIITDDKIATQVKQSILDQKIVLETVATQ